MAKISMVKPTVSMVATKGFSADGGGMRTIKRGTKFLQFESRVKAFIRQRLATEDFTPIDGVEVSDVLALARREIRTFDALRDLDRSVLEAVGVRPEAVGGILRWSSPDAQPEDDFTEIDGVATATDKKIKAKGVRAFAALAALDDEGLTLLGISNVAKGNIKTWQAEQAEEDE